jgi:Restriction endonuclease fold toxin 7
LTLSNGSPDGVDGPYINTALDGPDANGRARDRLRDEIARIDSRREQRLSAYEANSNAAYSAAVQAEDAALATAINVSVNGSDPSTLHPYVGLTDDGTKLYGATAENRVEVTGKRISDTVSSVAATPFTPLPQDSLQAVGDGFTGNQRLIERLSNNAYAGYTDSWAYTTGQVARTVTDIVTYPIVQPVLIARDAVYLAAQGRQLAPMSDVYKAAQQGDLLGMGVSAAGVMMPYGAGAIRMGRGAGAVESATARATRLGAQGEQAVGLFGPKVGIRIPGANNLRFPDGITMTTLTEVKNVQYQGLTNQLRDYVTYSQKNKLTFDLYVRGPLYPTGQTILTGPLEAAVKAGTIRLKFIPGTF